MDSSDSGEAHAALAQRVGGGELAACASLRTCMHTSSFMLSVTSFYPPSFPLQTQERQPRHRSQHSEHKAESQSTADRRPGINTLGLSLSRSGMGEGERPLPPPRPRADFGVIDDATERPITPSQEETKHTARRKITKEYTQEEPVRETKNRRRRRTGPSPHAEASPHARACAASTHVWCKQNTLHLQ